MADLPRLPAHVQIPQQRTSSPPDPGPTRHVVRGRHRVRRLAPTPWLVVPARPRFWPSVASALRATLWA
jgi:hypothetical protein